MKLHNAAPALLLLLGACTSAAPTEDPATETTPAGESAIEVPADLAQVTAQWETDWSQTTIDLAELAIGIHAADPRDRIAPLDDPGFEPAGEVAWLDERATGTLLAHGTALVDALVERLRARGASLLSQHQGARVPIASFTTADLDPAEVGVVLAEHDVHVRTGFHCAPWIHDHLGTSERGTVRVSPGPFVSEDDILRVAEILWP